ncbi:MAG: hypothetical protein IKJ29_00720 [Akkermansia sp.]|nr:hypothetical protein [Akkermansia sp.]
MNHTTMIIIHPKDRTTTMLCALYQGIEARRITQDASSMEIRHTLNLSPGTERIMLLGHGCPDGLYSRTDDTVEYFDRLIISHHHAYPLRRHGSNLIGIWCHADQFARKERLHGLFSGMIITELNEAEEHGIATTQEELTRENELLFTRLRHLLDTDTPLREVPESIAMLDEVHSPLTRFNYANFHFI